MTHKTYVLDTSVLIHDPKCFKNFKDNTIIIPVTVLEELDHIKSRSDNAGAHARAAIRYLENIISENPDANIQKGIDIGGNTIVMIDIEKRLHSNFAAGKEDDHILSCADHNKESILVSKDINMRLRAKAFNIYAQDYTTDKVTIDELYVGYRDIDLNDYDITVDPSKPFVVEQDSIFSELYPNECVKLIHNGTSSIMRKHCDSLGESVMVPIRIPDKVWGLKSRNQEQAYALDLLLDKNVPLVTLIGKAGTGKSLATTAAAMEQVIESKEYTNVQFYRPIVPMGRDVGYLPGSLEEKLDPWMGSIKDSITFLAGKDYDGFMHLYKNKVSMEALTFVRGRSLNKSLIVVDECQNISKNEVKTIITRVGFGSKIVLLGDIEQIDNYYLDAMDNGLSYVIEKFKNSYLAGHITLVKGERSPLATEASRVL